MADENSWSATRTVGELGAVEKLGHRIGLVASRAADEYKDADALMSWLAHLDEVLDEVKRRVGMMKGDE